MLHFKNFKLVEKGPEVGDPAGTIYAEADCGSCWYDVMDKFQPDTVKVQYDPEGNIQCVIHGAVSGRLWPLGGSVLELKELPAGFTQREFMVVGNRVLPKVVPDAVHT